MTRAQRAKQWASLLTDVIGSAEREFATASHQREISAELIVPLAGFLSGMRWLRSARSILADADRDIYGCAPTKKGTRAR